METIDVEYLPELSLKEQLEWDDLLYYEDRNNLPSTVWYDKKRGYILVKNLSNEDIQFLMSDLPMDNQWYMYFEDELRVRAGEEPTWCDNWPASKNL